MCVYIYYAPLYYKYDGKGGSFGGELHFFDMNFSAGNTELLNAVLMFDNRSEEYTIERVYV